MPTEFELIQSVCASIRYKDWRVSVFCINPGRFRLWVDPSGGESGYRREFYFHSDQGVLTKAYVKRLIFQMIVELETAFAKIQFERENGKLESESTLAFIPGR